MKQSQLQLDFDDNRRLKFITIKNESNQIFIIFAVLRPSVLQVAGPISAA